MFLYVNARDWYHLSEEARCGIRHMLCEQRLIEQGKHLIPLINCPSHKSQEAASLLGPETATVLRRAICAGLEAVVIISCPRWSQQAEKVGFIMAYRK